MARKENSYTSLTTSDAEQPQWRYGTTAGPALCAHELGKQLHLLSYFRTPSSPSRGTEPHPAQLCMRTSWVARSTFSVDSLSVLRTVTPSGELSESRCRRKEATQTTNINHQHRTAIRKHQKQNNWTYWPTTTNKTHKQTTYITTHTKPNYKTNRIWQTTNKNKAT